MPESDGGSELYGFNVEVKHADDGKYKEAGVVDKGSMDFTARALEVGEPYNFRVRAENRAGFGEYCPEFAKPVLAKPAHGRSPCINYTFISI